MLSKSLFIVLLILTRINFIFSSLKSEEFEISPSGVAQFPGSPQITLSSRKTIEEKRLVRDVSDGEYSITSEQQDVPCSKFDEVVEIKSLDQSNDVSRQVPIEKDDLETKKKKEKDEKRKFKKFWKKEDPQAYYSLPFEAGEYLPAYKAALKSNLKKLQLIASLNIGFEKHDPITGETPLHAACRSGNVNVFKFICSRIKDKRNLAALNRAGSTPFSVAVSSGNRELIKLMVQKCSLFKCDLADNYGRIPLMYAGLNGEKPIFDFLRNLGQNYLHHENSGRTLLSLILPSNPIFETLVELIEKDMKENNKGDTIRAIAADISIIYENETLGGKEQVNNLLSKFGTNLEEFISTPQIHRYNPLNVILRSKDYVLYRRLRHHPESGFDINSSNDYDENTFFDSCLQYGSIDMIDYLLSSNESNFSNSSILAILAGDRLDVLDFVLEKYPDLIPLNHPVKFISIAGMYKADKCFKFLLKKFWESEGGMDLFCEVATQITGTYKAEPIFQLFSKYAVGLSKCHPEYLEEMYTDLINYRRFSFENGDDWNNYENIKKIRKASRFLFRLFRERGLSLW